MFVLQPVRSGMSVSRVFQDALPNLEQSRVIGRHPVIDRYVLKTSLSGEFQGFVKDMGFQPLLRPAN
jgi:hypothetical protein